MTQEIEIHEDLEAALQRVVSLQQQRLNPELNHFLSLISQKEELLSTQILADKELHQPEGDPDVSRNEEKRQLSLEVSELQEALLNHTLIKSSLQEAAFNIQIQEPVRQNLQKMDVEKTMDHFPERGKILSHSSSNLHTSKDLASLVQEKHDLDQDILNLQLKNIGLLKEIKGKWEALNDSLLPNPEESQALANLQQKTKDREAKLQLLVTMIQGLITSSGQLWGASNYYVQVLLLCDSVVMHKDNVKQENIMKEISKIHEEREKNKGSTTKQRQTLIISSQTQRT